MEIVGHYQRPTTKSLVVIHFPWFVSIPLLALTGITVVVIGVMMAAHRELSNPFSAFEDLFGSDARQAALARGFTCQDIPFVRYPHIMSYCTQHFSDKPFSEIDVSLSNNRVSELRFLLGENTLTIGDLAALWGKPEIWLYCEAVVAVWPDHQSMGLVTSPRGKRISYFLPMIFISFTDSGQPRWKQGLMNDAVHDCGGVRQALIG